MEGGVAPFSSSMAPSGSYILIVVSQPMTEEHKQIILKRLEKGLLSWDVPSSGCDLSGLEYALSTNIKDRVTESDVLIQHSTESLGVEVLLSPTVRTLKQCVKNLLSTATSHKQLIHTGYAFAGSGSWILENGTFSFAEFLEIFKQAEVHNQKRCIINVHCAEEGDWSKTNFAKDIFTKSADVSLNPPEKVNHVPGSEHLINCLNNALIIQSLDEMMKPSPLVGNIRFNRPTIYMFPAGQGDCALFGINGFNMLIDGGFHRKPCSWDFVRHLDRLDAVLVTRIGESNVCGMSTLMKRNALNNANPQIGYVFCNIAENKSNALKNGTTEAKEDLLVSVVGEGHSLVQTLNDLKLKPHQCWRDSSVDPFVLYHKVGQGTLEMHVLSPPRDSKEMKSFLSEWNAYKETFSGVKSELKGGESLIPLSHATSICAILVWRPEDPKDTITRILFPGSAPQNKILEGLEKLRVLNILNHPVVTKASLKIPSSKVISNKVEKSVSRTSIPNRNNTASPALSISSVASRNGDIGGTKKDPKEVKKVIKEVKKESKELKKEVKKDVRKDTVKEVKKEIKIENSIKKDSLAKKESTKEVKKDTKEVKKIIKKESKDVKVVNDKKEVKSTPKKEATTPSSKTTTEVKKTVSNSKKTSTPIKKDVGKPPIAPKTADTKKAGSKTSETKTVKDVNNKKSLDSKTVTKTKPKSTSASPKTPTTPKTKPIAVPKPGSKMTKAVAASSIVASAVAVTVAAVELNEKKDIIEDTEQEVSEKEVVAETKEIVVNEKLAEDVVSPLPPEALSPTPSESVSLTPSDTLSSAPLETVSPTPPLPNEPVSAEEKFANDIKELEQDMPYEQEKAVEVEFKNDDIETENEVNDIEAELAKHQVNSDVMSTSFIAENQNADFENEEHFEKVNQNNYESAAFTVEDDASEKDIIVAENDTPMESAVEKQEPDDDDDSKEEKADIIGQEDFKEHPTEDNYTEHEKEFKTDKKSEEKEVMEEKEFVEEKEVMEEKEFVEEKESNEEKDVVEEKIITENRDLVEEKSTVHVDGNTKEICSDEESIEVVKETAHDSYFVHEKNFQENEVMEEMYDSKKNDDLQEMYDSKKNDDLEEMYDSKEKDIVQEENEGVKEINVAQINDSLIMRDSEDEINTTVECNMGENDAVSNKNKFDAYEENEDIDDKLAKLTMEGSFCASMMSSNEDDIPIKDTQDIEVRENRGFDDNESNYYSHTVEHPLEEQYDRKVISENEHPFETKISEDDISTIEKEDNIQVSNQEFSTVEHDKKDALTFENYDSRNSEKSELASHESLEMETDQKKNINPYMNEAVDYNYDINLKEPAEHMYESDANNFEKLSHIQSMESSFHQDVHENFEPTNLDGLEMQETSVDEPEEIIRKESVVSITLNDKNSEEHYVDNWRRKSGTESEDDVDIGKYMCKEQTVDEEKLSVQRGSDSDEEDVVKSPTPHAVVDYEGQLDDIESSTKTNAECIGKEIPTEKEIYLNEKQDFDEKDRDSAEEQDTDDGEMIRHPTPPEIKYSEEEMRDPIGPHIITNPNLICQGSDITDQPLYEEAEDSASERSVSPVIEQPVFGNVVKADFPELVTVSGGTTPSEPQSPKSNFDVKKFATEEAVMEALSEHDISESSTHSPSCQDGSNTFDLQGSERSVIEVQNLQDDDAEKAANEEKQSSTLDDIRSDSYQISTSDHSNVIEGSKCDEDDSKEDKKETPSDEDESSSEEENSESHSRDKSDAMGDRSDFERDDKSDVHTDDKSDHHHDKSDVLNDDDDDDKSDIHEDEQLYRQQHKYADFEEDLKELKTDTQDETEIVNDNANDIYAEKQYDYANKHEDVTSIKNLHTSNALDEIQMEKDFDSESHSFEKNEIHNEMVYKNVMSSVNVDGISTADLSSNSPFFDNDYLNQKHIDNSKTILESESTFLSENYESSSQYKNSFEEKVQSEVLPTSDYETSPNAITVNETDGNISDKENSDTFRKIEADFEYSKRDNDFHSFNTFASENENKNESVEFDSDNATSNLPDNLQEVPTAFTNADNFEMSENKFHLESEHGLSSPNSDDKAVEEKLSSEVAEIHRYENMGQYDENQENYHVTNLGSDLISNFSSRENQDGLYFSSSEESKVTETGYSCVNSEIQSFSTTNTYEYSSSSKMNESQEQNMTFENISTNESSYNKPTQLEYDTEDTAQNFGSDKGLYQPNADYTLENEQYLVSRTQFVEPQKELEIHSEYSSENYAAHSTEFITKNGFTSETTSNDSEKILEGESHFPVADDKHETTYSLPSAEITNDFLDRELSNKDIGADFPQQSEQESTYSVHNRFQSDSPEDNTMRSDSSPDVPYPADLPDKFSENSNSTETCSETFMHNTKDYTNNMNFSSSDIIPMSTQNLSLNANQNTTYVESSEEDLVRSNISPYAYTNKAYAREEEDIDGNHIYKEETTEVIKQVEFDGNNLQTLNSNQVTSVLNYSQEYQGVDYSTGANYDFRLEEWGKPMGLPTPPDSTQKTGKKTDKVTVKSKSNVDANGKVHSPSVSSKLSSPLKKPKPKTKESSSSPVYVDLAYVPQHADPQYCDVEFFKKIRARYYVISSVNPSKEVLNALLEAKKTWNEDLSVTIIPTYETDTLGYWMAQNQDDLAEYSIDVSPSASRCTVNLQDHQTSCSAYRLEF